MWPRSVRVYRSLKKDFFSYLKSLTSGLLAKDSGCILKTSLVQKIFRNNCLNKIKSSSWLINFGETSWSKPTKDPSSMTVVPVKNFSRNSRKTTENLKKSRRRWRTISRSKELLSHDFISYQTMNSSKFYHRPEILMRCNLISENALTT